MFHSWKEEEVAGGDEKINGKIALTVYLDSLGMSGASEPEQAS